MLRPSPRRTTAEPCRASRPTTTRRAGQAAIARAPVPPRRGWPATPRRGSWRFSGKPAAHRAAQARGAGTSAGGRTGSAQFLGVARGRARRPSAGRGRGRSTPRASRRLEPGYDARWCRPASAHPARRRGPGGEHLGVAQRLDRRARRPGWSPARHPAPRRRPRGPRWSSWTVDMPTRSAPRRLPQHPDLPRASRSAARAGRRRRLRSAAGSASAGELRAAAARRRRWRSTNCGAHQAATARSGSGGR